jgi:hypothetical protein
VGEVLPELLPDEVALPAFSPVFSMALAAAAFCPASGLFDGSGFVSSFSLAGGGVPPMERTLALGLTADPSPPMLRTLGPPSLVKTLGAAGAAAGAAAGCFGAAAGALGTGACAVCWCV